MDVPSKIWEEICPDENLQDSTQCSETILTEDKSQPLGKGAGDPVQAQLPLVI